MLFKKKKVDVLASQWIVNRLVQMEERPWPEFIQREPITTRQIASLLLPFGIKPKVLSRKKGSTSKRGYSLKKCQNAFDRYVP